MCRFVFLSILFWIVIGLIVQETATRALPTIPVPVPWPFDPPVIVIQEYDDHRREDDSFSYGKILYAPPTEPPTTELDNDIIGPTNDMLPSPSGGPEWSPVTLNPEWGKLARLVALVALAAFGVVNNGFFVSAFFVDDALKKVGNVFVCCLGLADLLVTAVALPVPVVALLADDEDTDGTLCRCQHFVVSSCSYGYLLFSLLVATESYLRIKRSGAAYSWFTSMRVGLVCGAVVVLSTALGGAGVFLGLDLDYCQRQHHGNRVYRIVTSALVHVLPFLITAYFLVYSFIRIRLRAKRTHYRRSQQFTRDKTQLNLSICAYFTFIITWFPFTIIAYKFPDIDNKTFYYLAWLGTGRCVISSMLYSLCNRVFRRAYGHLFNYCCCKSSLVTSFSNHQRRNFDYRPPTGDVRVHIMHQMMTSNASATRDSEEL